MKVKILDVYELNNTLVVEAESEYGKHKMGLGLHQKYLDPVTGKPRWYLEMIDKLKKRYEPEFVKRKECPEFNKFKNKEFKLDEA